MSKGKDLFVKNMINLYLTDMPIEIDKIKIAIAQQDYQAIQAVAHKIKSSVGIIGMYKEGVDMIAEIELNAANKTSMQTISDTFYQFEMLINKSINELKII